MPLYSAKCSVKRNVASDVVSAMRWILRIKVDVTSMKRKLCFQVVAANFKTYSTFVIWKW